MFCSTALNNSIVKILKNRREIHWRTHEKKDSNYKKWSENLTWQLENELCCLTHYFNRPWRWLEPWISYQVSHELYQNSNWSMSLVLFKNVTMAFYRQSEDGSCSKLSTLRSARTHVLRAVYDWFHCSKYGSWFICPFQFLVVQLTQLATH